MTNWNVRRSHGLIGILLAVRVLCMYLHCVKVKLRSTFHCTEITLSLVASSARREEKTVNIGLSAKVNIYICNLK